jgi:DNA-binding CsgD family transcriptional regulator/GAF domain-containing protein
MPADARARVDELRTRLRASLDEEPGEAPDLIAGRLRMLVELDQERYRMRLETIRTGVEDLVGIHQACVRMRVLKTPAELIDAAPRELFASCGFTRAMISRVEGSLWNPQVLETVEGIDPEVDRFREFIETTEIPLSHLLLESELVRRRIPALVTDPVGDPRTDTEIVKVSRSTSYVASPIMPTGQVIGFLHADRFGQDAPCSPEDRDNLWAFAEHFGLLFERAVLRERLETQRDRLKETLMKAATTIDEVCDAELDLQQDDEPLADGAGRRWHGRERPSPIEALLTPREREVLELMVTGATNTMVAQQLVVSEGTVKSHVKRILRKLHASNRAEAVARYLRLTRQQGERGRR